jgi:mRNA interferase MazF
MKLLRNARHGRREISLNISRGEIWLVNLDPTIGAEIQKTRPVVVVGSDAVGVLPIKLVAPLTEWNDHLASNVWHAKVLPDSTNGLVKTSAVDALQLRGVDTQRFVQKIGNVSPPIMRSIVAAIAAVIEYEP